MRVLQLIDSLDAGGAERMAVNLANELSNYIERSFLCATRKEGILKQGISKSVGYLFLNRTRTLDPGAIMRLRSYVKRNKINVIHAHGTSFFIATQVKLVHPKLRVIWHAHHGNRVTTTREQNKTLYYCSQNFSGIITVNSELKEWCSNNLKTKKVAYLPNFVASEGPMQAWEERKKELICLANLKAPKNHLNLLNAFKKVHDRFPDWQLILIGKDYKDAYSKEIEEFCADHNLNKKVALLGQRSDVKALLASGSIGVLASDNEGLPMALLEYGVAGLAVVATDVGECKAVIDGHGLVVSALDSDALAEALIAYISDENLRKRTAERYRMHILQKYSFEAIVPRLLEFY